MAPFRVVPTSRLSPGMSGSGVGTPAITHHDWWLLRRRGPLAAVGGLLDRVESAQHSLTGERAGGPGEGVVEFEPMCEQLQRG